jgi:hypothetical protein
VIAPSDPGVANWLDTEARTEVMCTMRWWRARGTPLVRSETVPAASIHEQLPAGTPVFDAAERRAQTRARSTHVAHRYRT